jgi:hypothetical protein
MTVVDATIIWANALNDSTPALPHGVTGGKTPNKYMFSELPQIADVVRRVRRYSASSLVLQITAFWAQAIPG